MADTILDGNPHADQHGNKDVWSFVQGPSRPVSGEIGWPVDSRRIRSSAGGARPSADPARQAEAAKLAEQVQALLERPAAGEGERPRPQSLYDQLVSAERPAVRRAWTCRASRGSRGRRQTVRARVRRDSARDRVGPAGRRREPGRARRTRSSRCGCPPALFRGREFVVDGRLDSTTRRPRGPGRRVRGAARAGRRAGTARAPVVATPGGAAYKRLVRGLATSSAARSRCSSASPT